VLQAFDTLFKPAREPTKAAPRGTLLVHRTYISAQAAHIPHGRDGLRFKSGQEHASVAEVRAGA